MVPKRCAPVTQTGVEDTTLLSPYNEHASLETLLRHEANGAMALLYDHTPRRRLSWPWIIALITGTALITVYIVLSASLASPQPLGASFSIGWQSNQIAFSASKASRPSSEEDAASTSSRPSPKYEASSNGYPNIWSPWTYNPVPITELYLLSCAFSPSIWNACTPPSSYFEDISAGPWVRLDKDLNRKTGLWYLYLFYRRRLPGSPLPVLQDIMFLTPEEARAGNTSEKLRTEGWQMLDENLHSGIWESETMNLWYKRSFNTTNSITELDLVYGDGDLRPSWEDSGKISKVKNEAVVRLQARRTPIRLPSMPDLAFDSSGNFTILQIADLHFSVDGGSCRDIANSTACPSNPDQADQATLAWLQPLLEEVKPDLVVLTGDQLNGQDTSWDAPSVIYKVASLFANTTIPWTVIFGNHDSESTNVNRRNQMELYQSFPWFVGQVGPADVKGAGNYLLPIYSSDESKTNLFNLYFIDSHSSFKPLFGKYQYESIDETQIRWLKNISDRVRPILRPFQPADLSFEDSAFGLANDLDRDNIVSSGNDRFPDATRRQEAILDQYLKKPNAMAFFHIPVPEAYDPADRSIDGSVLLEKGTTDLEGYSAPEKNSGFFSKALLTQLDVDSDSYDDAVSPRPEIKVTVHGHSHLRDACSRIRNVWMCFSGGSSYSGYGMRGFDRRVRVFRLSDYGETISTWKILDGSGRGDRESGVFEATVAQQEPDSRPSDSVNSPPSEHEQEVEDLVNELLAEEQAALDASDTQQAEEIENIVQDIEAEYIADQDGERLERRQGRPIIATDRRDSSRLLDYTVLVGRDAWI